MQKQNSELAKGRVSPYPWLAALFFALLALLQFILWRRKKTRTIQLEAELRLLARYKELLEKSLNAETLSERQEAVTAKLVALNEEIASKQEALDEQLGSLAAEKEKINAALNWKELLGK